MSQTYNKNTTNDKKVIGPDSSIQYDSPSFLENEPQKGQTVLYYIKFYFSRHYRTFRSLNQKKVQKSNKIELTVFCRVQFRLISQLFHPGIFKIMKFRCWLPSKMVVLSMQITPYQNLPELLDPDDLLLYSADNCFASLYKTCILFCL